MPSAPIALPTASNEWKNLCGLRRHARVVTPDATKINYITIPRLKSNVDKNLERNMADLEQNMFVFKLRGTYSLEEGLRVFLD